MTARASGGNVTTARIDQPENLLSGTPYRASAATILGKGAMGVVYLAEHAALGTKCVVKVLLPELAKYPDLVERMRVEAQALARLKSPFLLTCTDFGRTPAGVPYLVTEYLEGRTLAEELYARSKLPVAEAIDITIQLLRGLAVAHAEGIVHRDVKPANIFLSRDAEGRPMVKVLDFGVAKVMTKLAAVAPSAFPTAEGSIVGTPRFCSPEQARGESVDLRCDIYSTGLLLVYLTTGRGPYAEKKNMAEILLAHAFDVALAPSSLEPSLDSAFDQVVLKALAKQPSDRYANAGAFIAALDNLRVAPVAAAPAVALPVATTNGEGDATEPDAKSPAWIPDPEPGRQVASAADDPTVMHRPRVQERDVAVAWVASGAANVRETVRLDLPIVADPTFSPRSKLATPAQPAALPAWWLVIGALAVGAIVVFLVILVRR